MIDLNRESVFRYFLVNNTDIFPHSFTKVNSICSDFSTLVIISTLNLSPISKQHVPCIPNKLSINRLLHIKTIIKIGRFKEKSGVFLIDLKEGMSTLTSTII